MEMYGSLWKTMEGYMRYVGARADGTGQIDRVA